MSTARKMFIGRVTVPALAATSLYALMRDSPLHWGFETTALTDPSLDSIIGDEVGIVPDSAVRVCSDSSAAATAGIAVATAQNFSLQDFAVYGLIDPNQVYFYSQSGTGMAVTFHGR